MVKKIQLQGKHGNGKFVLVDDGYYDELSQHRWYLGVNGYVTRGEWDGSTTKAVLMHRQIMSPPDGMVVDHVNMNKLDNRLENLRLATTAENVRNGNKRKTGDNPYKGVHFQKHIGKWKVEITKDYKNHHFGVFEDPELAARVYDAKASEMFGEFARLNFPGEPLIDYTPPVTRSDNTSGYRGVSFYKSRNQWITQINKNKIKHFIGYFNCKHEAARAYNEKAKELYGDKAKLNEILDEAYS